MGPLRTGRIRRFRKPDEACEQGKQGRRLLEIKARLTKSTIVNGPKAESGVPVWFYAWWGG